MSVLIEGFENWSGGLPVGWSSVATGALVVTQSTSHVTQGTYSLQLTMVPGGSSSFQSSSRTILAGVYTIDFYNASAPTRSVAFSVIGGTGPFATSSATSGTLTFTVPADTPSAVFRLTSVGTGNVDAYFDNLRLDQDTVIPVTAPKRFELDYPKSGPVPGDWYSPDWNTSDWFTGSSGNFLIRAFVDTVVPITDTKHFELSFGTPTVVVDQYFHIDTKHFELSFGTPVIIADQIITIDAPKHFVMTVSTGIEFVVGAVFRPDTKHFYLRPKDVYFYFELLREYPVSLSLPFDYEILGVSVNSVAGSGRFSILSDNQVLVQELEFSPNVTNYEFSDIIVERGKDLIVMVFIQNEYFQSFKADFAMKRTEGP